MKKILFILICIAIFVFLKTNSHALNLNTIIGAGYQKDMQNKEDYFAMPIGIGGVFPFQKSSAFDLNISLLINDKLAGGKFSQKYLIISNNIQLAYRNYFGLTQPSSSGTRFFYPFFAVAFNNLIYEQKSYVPGIEIQLAFDLLFGEKSLIIDSGMGSGCMSSLFGNRQTLSFALWSSVYFYNSNYIVNVGLKMSFGTIF